jgi:GntR family transcriptional regulator
MNQSQSVNDLFSQYLPPLAENLVVLTANRIRNMITNGSLAPGSRLPNEHELSGALGVSRGTIRAALNLLQQQGLLWRRQGVGTFISEVPLLENRLDLNFSYTALIRSMGHQPGCKLLDIRVIPADELSANRLQVEESTPLVCIRRIRTADELEDLRRVLSEKISLYQVFEEDLHQTIDYGITRLRPIAADSQLIKQFALDIPRGSVMLYMEQLDFDRNRQPILFSHEYHLAEHTTFTIYRRR